MSLALAVLLYVSMTSTAEKSALVEQSEEVLHGLGLAVAKYDDSIASLRGFGRSHEERYVVAYRELTRDVETLFERLSSLLAYDPVRRELLDRLRRVFRERGRLIEEMIAVQRQSGTPAALKYGHDRGLDDMVARIWATISEMQTEQKRLLSERVRTVLGASRITFRTFAVGIAGNLVIIATAFIYMARQVQQRVIAEEALRKAKDAAEAANRAKGEFLANMSHEIRTPMNGILGMTELALGTELTREQAEYLRLVKCSADALLTVINDILDFSKIDAGKMELSPGEFGLHGLMAETVRTLAVKAHEKGLTLECEIDDELPDRLIGDSGRLRQIIMNLLGNSIKFTERGGIVARAGVERGGAGEKEVVIRVSIADTGVGINPAKLGRIFEPFEQEDNSITRRFGGTGLGLPISSKLVELMGGKMWVESEPGRGSTFHFTARLAPVEKLVEEVGANGNGKGVPMRLGVGGAVVERTEAMAVSEGGSTCGMGRAGEPGGCQVGRKRARVLLAEDHPVNQKLATRMLEKAGHKVTVVGDGLQAVQAVEAGMFDVLIMDVQMPVMGGFEAIERIRMMADRTKSRLPAIAVTAHAMKGDRERCLAAGFDGYLSKPVNGKSLAEEIARFLPAMVEEKESLAGLDQRTL